MPAVAVLEVGATAVTALVVGLDREVRARAVRSAAAGAGGDLPARDAPTYDALPYDARTYDPRGCEALARETLAEVAGAVPPQEWLGAMVVAPRQAVVLTTDDDQVLGRRGLRAVAQGEPELWRRTRRAAALHDWLVARMTGVQASALPHACATGLVDVPARRWSADLLSSSGIAPQQLAPVVETGCVVGELGAGWGLPETLPVVAGAVRSQLVSTAAGGLADGVLTIAAGPGGFAQLASASPVSSPDGWWPATHAVPGLWSLERPLDDGAQDLRAQAEAALGRPLVAVVDVPAAEATPVSAAAVLVARAVGAHAHLPHRRS